MKENLNLKFQKLIIYIVFLAFLKPNYLGEFAWLDVLFNLVRLACFAYVVLYTLISKKISRLTLIITGCALCPLISTIVHSGQVLIACRLLVLSTCIIMWCDYLSKNHPFIIIEVLSNLLDFLIVINFLTIILVPGGLYTYTAEGWSSDKAWLFGLRNGHIKYLMLGCFCSLVRLYYSKKQTKDYLRMLFVHAVVILTIYELSSGGGYVILTAYAVMIIVYKICKQIRIDFSFGIIFHIVLFFAITLFSFTMLFTGFFGLFSKNGSATGRTTIWALTWSRIYSSPLIGYGYMNNDELSWLTAIASGATTSHNALIDMLFRGGILCFVMFISGLFEIRKQLKKISSNIRLYNLISCGFIVVFLTAQSEGGMDSCVIYLFLGIISVLPKIDRMMVQRSEATRKKTIPQLHLV